ncbi:MAG: hypothetical protein FWC27_11420 [Firmicutes bacterium]|nr:hypothetical protein [Bacillota bacterium]
MKHAKKLLALLLAFVMAVGLGVSVLAEEPLPDIITQPRSQTITNGDSFTLSVEMYVPAGWAVEYQWVVVSYGVYEEIRAEEIQGATQQSLRLSPGDPFYPPYPPEAKRYGSSLYYRCNIRTVRNGDGAVLKPDSHPAEVYLKPTLGWRIANFLLGIWDFLTTPFRYIYYAFFGWE